MTAIPSRQIEVTPGKDSREPSKIRVLTLVHNHPHFHPGGAEIHALEIHRAMKESDRFEPLLLAAAPGWDFPTRSNRSLYRLRSDDPSELLWAVDDFDHFHLTGRDKESYTRDLRSVLERFEPHVVHVQHFLQLGLDALTEIRMSGPDVPIVFTLHEFLPICHSRGIMLRRGTTERCSGSSPWRCHQCFPEHSPEEFFLRDKFVRAQLEHVDLFLAPSHALKSRYVDWGIPADRIRFQDYGRQAPPRRSIVPVSSVDTRRFVFLGQVMRHKGILVLLQAMQILARRRRDDITLAICGTNLHFDGDEYVREVGETIEALEGRVVLRGGYEPHEIPSLLEGMAWVVVPSIWWENSPLVIQEAFANGRPVLCSDIGGMAEKVRHEVDGLHFRAGDPVALADTMEKVAGNDDLWERLHSGIPPIYTLDEALLELEQIYNQLLGADIRVVPLT
jgi:glycosyltransferase involved in cell wall biosynthesis